MENTQNAQKNLAEIVLSNKDDEETIMFKGTRRSLTALILTVMSKSVDFVQIVETALEIHKSNQNK